MGERKESLALACSCVTALRTALVSEAMRGTHMHVTHGTYAYLRDGTQLAARQGGDERLDAARLHDGLLGRHVGDR